MEVLTSSNTAEMATTFIWTGLAATVGSLVIGPLFDHVNGMLLLAGCLMLEGICMELAPTWPVLATFQILVATATAFHFSILSGGLSINRYMWKNSPNTVPPVIQTTTLARTIGLSIGPQMARPFVGHSVHTLHSQANEIINVTSSTLQIGHQGLHPVQVAYMIAGVLNISMTMICLITCAATSVGNGQCTEGLGNWYKRDPEYDDVVVIPDNTDTAWSNNQPTKLEPCSRQGFATLVVVCLMLFANGGIGGLATFLLYTYLYEYLGLSVNAAATLVTMYHMTRFVGGAVAVFMSRRVSPIPQNIFNVCTLAVASVLLMASLAAGDVLTTVGVVVLGVGMSNIHATTFTMVDENIHVTAPVMALLISASCACDAIILPVCGVLLHNVGALGFPAMLSALTFISVASLIVYVVFGRVMKSQ